jgi:hypothetical protein
MGGRVSSVQRKTAFESRDIVGFSVEFLYASSL